MQVAASEESSNLQMGKTAPTITAKSKFTKAPTTLNEGTLTVNPHESAPESSKSLRAHEDSILLVIKIQWYFFILDYSVTPGILTIYNLSNSFEQKRKVPGVYVSGSPRIRKHIHQALAVKKWQVLIQKQCMQTAG